MKPLTLSQKHKPVNLLHKKGSLPQQPSPFSLQSGEFTIELFIWGIRGKPIGHYCEVCGRNIGVWAWKHSRKCQHCNMRDSNKKRKQARENHVQEVHTL